MHIVRRGRLVLALLVVVVAAGAALLWWRRGPSAPPPPTALVEVADITQVVRVAGRLRPRVTVDVGAQVSGQIKDIRVELGDRVRRGQLLLIIDPETAQNEVRKAEAAVARQAATNDSTGVDLRADRVELARQSGLLAAGASPASEVDAARRRVDRDAAELRAGHATLLQLQAELRNRRVELGFTRVHAPIDGIVASRPAQAGQTVNAVQQTPLLMVLAQLGTMTVRAKVPEADIALLKVGQTASFATLGAGSRRYGGRIRAIEPQPEAIHEAMFYNALFEVGNADEALRSDMTVQVDIVTGLARGVPTIPVVALGDRAPDGSYAVRLQDAQGRVESRRIRVGIHDDARVQVLSGLDAGARVMLEPASAPAPAGS